MDPYSDPIGTAMQGERGTSGRHASDWGLAALLMGLTMLVLFPLVLGCTILVWQMAFRKPPDKGNDPKQSSPVATVRLLPLQPVTLQPDQSVRVSVTVRRSGDTGRLTVVAKLPAGLSASAATILPGQDHAAITLVATAEARPGEHTATLQIWSDSNTLLDGKQITDLSMSRDAVEGNQIGFLVTFDDSSTGMYLATVLADNFLYVPPEPNATRAKRWPPTCSATAA